MPATRPHLDRAAKEEAILDAAEELLLRDGYEQTAMAAVARAAGVANNAVYWYFPSKDEVLAAVLRRRLDRGLAHLDALGLRSPEALVGALLAELDEVAGLTAAVHQRVAHSPALAEVHRDFHAAAEDLLRRGFLAEMESDEDAGRTAAAVMAMIEGVHLHSTSRDTEARDRLVLWAVRRLGS